MDIQGKLCSKKKDEFQKVMSLAILGGLPTASHSLALSHYWPTQRLLAAGFPLWPIPPRLRQPDPPWLPREVHVDAGLSADAGSTWTNGHQKSLPQAIQQNLPPSSWITRACQSSRQKLLLRNEKHTQTVHHVKFRNKTWVFSVKLYHDLKFCSKFSLTKSCNHLDLKQINVC